MLSFDVNIAIVLIMYWSNHTLMHSNFTNTCLERNYERCWIIISALYGKLEQKHNFFPTHFFRNIQCKETSWSTSFLVEDDLYLWCQTIILWLNGFLSLLKGNKGK